MKHVLIGLFSSATLVAGCAMEGDVGSSTEAVQYSEHEANGRDLFHRETFDGNGRVCADCHQPTAEGTIDPAFVQDLFARDPSNPLFASIDSDDGVGSDFTQLLERATVNVTVPLPPNFRPCNDLDATSVVVRRGVPTVANTGLESVFNADGTASALSEQAGGAIFAHFEPGRAPSAGELDDIEAFQATLFNRRELLAFAEGGDAPELPAGRTPEEIRGREFYLPDGHCGVCHSGPMLNEASEFHPYNAVGARFDFIHAGTLTVQPQPRRAYCVVNPSTGAVIRQVRFLVADPGLGAATGIEGDLDVFKTPTLWGAADTAPYFHDNSALTIEEMVDHYAAFFVFRHTHRNVNIRFDPAQFPALTQQDKSDIIAYFHLLGSQRGVRGRLGQGRGQGNGYESGH